MEVVRDQDLKNTSERVTLTKVGTQRLIIFIKCGKLRPSTEKRFSLSYPMMNLIV